MTPTRPYLIRGLYEWIADNNLTPFIVVNTEIEGVIVPHEYVDGGRIILNIAMMATDDLVIGNNVIEFSARFSGISKDIIIPIAAVLAIYAKENGRGMVFNEDDLNGNDDEGNSYTPAGNSSPTKNSKGKPKLTLVK